MSVKYFQGRFERKFLYERVKSIDNRAIFTRLAFSFSAVLSPGYTLLTVNIRK